MAWTLKGSIKGPKGDQGDQGEQGIQGDPGADGADADVAADIHSATSKTTPVNADELGLVDSAASNALKKLTWANLKTALGSVFASSAQGALADSATQPGDLSTVATTGAYNDLTGKPTLGTAAATAASAYATAAQGTLADSAVQPGDLGAVATSNSYDDLDDKPTIPSEVDELTDLDTVVTGTQLDAMQTKLAGIEEGADVTDATNVNAAGAVMNSDTSTAAMGFVNDEDDFTSNSATKVPTQQSTKAYVDGAVSALHAVASSGDYEDLTGKPTLGTAAATSSGDYATAAQGALADSATQPGDLAAVATSGDYDDLSNKPTIPDGVDIHGATAKSTPVDADELALIDTEASNVLKKFTWANLKTALGSVFASSAQGTLADSAVQPGDLGAVATSNSYDDLDDKPTIGSGGILEIVEDTTPQLGGNLDLNTHNVGAASAADLTKLSEITASSTELNYVDGVTSAVQDQLDGKATSAQGALADSATQPGDLATVATSGDYDDLSNKPTIPAVNAMLDDIEWIDGPVDFNTLTTPGAYFVAGEFLNGAAPEPNTYNVPGDSGLVLLLVTSTDHPSAGFVVTQQFYSVNNYAFHGYRRRYDGTWNGWVRYDHGFQSSLSSMGVTATSTELNYVDGVTSSIQPQLDAKGIKVEDEGNATTTEYHKIATLPIDNTSNKSNLAIFGRIGGWVNQNQAQIQLILTNRSGPVDGNTVSAAVIVLGGIESAKTILDIVVYKEADLSATVYLKLDGYYAYSFSAIGNWGCNIDHNGTDVTPTGSEIWDLWSAPRLEVDQQGNVIGSTAPTQAAHLARKDYVDSAALPEVDKRQSNGSVYTTSREAIYTVYNFDSEWMHLAYVYPNATITIDSIDIPISQAPTGTTTLCRVGVYQADSSGNLTLIGSSANDATLFDTPNSVRTASLSSPVELVVGTVYAFGLLVISDGDMPRVKGTETHYSVSNLFPRLSGYANPSVSDLPASLDYWDVHGDNSIFFMRGYEA